MILYSQKSGHCGARLLAQQAARYLTVPIWLLLAAKVERLEQQVVVVAFSIVMPNLQ